MKIYKIVYKSEYKFTEEELKELLEDSNGSPLDNVIQECIDQDSSEHSDKDNWTVELEPLKDVQKKILNKYNN